MALVGAKLDGRGPGVEPYWPELEPWYVFVHNEGYRGFDAPYGQKLTAYTHPPPYRTFMVRDGALYVGLVDLGLVPDDERALSIEAIGLLPHYRRRGLGGLLIGAANGFAKEARFTHLQAVVRALDPRVHVFLTRHGFEVAALGLDVERTNGERACIPPAELSLEAAGLSIRNLLYIYRRSVV